MTSHDPSKRDPGTAEALLAYMRGVAEYGVAALPVTDVERRREILAAACVEPDFQPIYDALDDLADAGAISLVDVQPGCVLRYAVLR